MKRLAGQNGQGEASAKPKLMGAVMSARNSVTLSAWVPGLLPNLPPRATPSNFCRAACSGTASLFEVTGRRALFASTNRYGVGHTPRARNFFNLDGRLG